MSWENIEINLRNVYPVEKSTVAIQRSVQIRRGVFFKFSGQHFVNESFHFAELGTEMPETMYAVEFLHNYFLGRGYEI